MVLIDGQQTALTGFGNQSSLENIPASSIEKIEIINNPSVKHDANGNGGIINIIYKKQKKLGLNGKAGFVGGFGALWLKKQNYPDIRPQYQATPKLNPSLTLNYRSKKMNFFLQADDRYNKTLNKNEFVDRLYSNGDTILQQTVRNRTTNIVTGKTGIDWYVNDANTISVSALYSREKILDRGDEPFFQGQKMERLRLWSFLEDEVKTTTTATGSWRHKFAQPGRTLGATFNYTFHREDEQYFFKDTKPQYRSADSFKLLSDEHVADFSLDYMQPLKQGHLETGVKFRRRYIPTNMQFKPGSQSALDSSAGGAANYTETIPAIYGNYVFENERLIIEAGVRVEFARINYWVNPNHPVYETNGYDYIQPFPSFRVGYKLNTNNQLSITLNRRVDRPNEVDIRIFPKYDDAEIIKVGNPGLKPQFTNAVELGWKSQWKEGYNYLAAYHQQVNGTISRIGITVPGSNLIYNIFQNAGKSYRTGIELITEHRFSGWFKSNFNINAYNSVIDDFSVVSQYPVEKTFSAGRQELFSANFKLNSQITLLEKIEAQILVNYQLPDLIPQGKIYSRFSVDVGARKAIQNNKGELVLNISDLFNTLRFRKTVQGNNFNYTSVDYYETQVFRIGYSLKF